MYSLTKGLLKKLLALISKLNFLIDIVILPITLLGGSWLRIAKYIGLKNLPLTAHLLKRIGVFPIVDHYYELQFDFSKMNFGKDRDLSSIDFNVERQLHLIQNFNYQNELKNLPLEKSKELKYYYHNTSFQSGDAELFYSIIRDVKPSNIIEIGSGNSTLLAMEAIKANKNDCTLTCIEPYEIPWLENLGVNLIRKRVEHIEPELFDSLESGDILFIDSSHVIRPQGDVMFEIFNILPRLKSGVLVHFHDIFSPNEYPREWLVEEYRFWNEQYLLEAFLSFNKEFSVMAAMNFLKTKHFDAISKVFPIIATETYREPGSFWIIKN